MVVVCSLVNQLGSPYGSQHTMFVEWKMGNLTPIRRGTGCFHNLSNVAHMQVVQSHQSGEEWAAANLSNAVHIQSVRAAFLRLEAARSSGDWLVHTVSM